MLSRPLVSSGYPSVGQAMVECHCCRSKMLDVQGRQHALPSVPVVYVLRRHGFVLDKVIAVFLAFQGFQRRPFWDIIRALEFFISPLPSSFLWSGTKGGLSLPVGVVTRSR